MNWLFVGLVVLVCAFVIVACGGGLIWFIATLLASSTAAL